jgi:hypothetical protein
MKFQFGRSESKTREGEGELNSVKRKLLVTKGGSKSFLCMTCLRFM